MHAICQQALLWSRLVKLKIGTLDLRRKILLFR